MSWLSRHTAQPAIPVEKLTVAWQAVALLMDYPDSDLQLRCDEIADALVVLPPSVRDPLLRLTRHIATTPLMLLQSDYVSTFDHTRKCALHLTYYASGDTRKRGVALVKFKQVFRSAGVEVSSVELPDHLSVVCEFGATVDADKAFRLFLDHRAGLEVLRMALERRHSPWLDGVAGLLATLPPLDGEGSEAVAKLLAEGPPNEDVGLEPFALDPRLEPSYRPPSSSHQALAEGVYA